MWLKATIYVMVLSIVSALRMQQNGRHFADDIFKCIVLNKYNFIFIIISLKFVPVGWIEKKKVIIGSINGLVQNRQQGIGLMNDSLE